MSKEAARDPVTRETQYLSANFHASAFTTTMSVPASIITLVIAEVVMWVTSVIIEI